MWVGASVAKISKQLAENKQAGQGGSAFPGLSFVERLFICLTIGALFFGLIISWYTQSTETKLTQTKQSGIAVSQWIQSAYRLKTTRLNLSDETGEARYCAGKEKPISKACILELIQDNNIFKSLQNPFFPENRNASLIAVFDSQAGIPEDVSPCASLSDSFSLFTASGLFNGKPKAWRGTIMLYVPLSDKKTSDKQTSDSKTSDNKAELITGYCNEGGRYERLVGEIQFSK